MTENRMPSPKHIIDMASAFYDSCVLFSASDLGIFNMLAETGGAGVNEIASRLSLDPRGLRLIMDSCAALGLVEKDGDIYKNTAETSIFLVSGSPGDLSGAIRYNRDVFDAWGKLPELIKTGRPVEQPETHLGADPERTRTFVLSMHARAMGIGRGAVAGLDLSGRKKLLDIGGGPGTYSVLIAQANPEIQCTVIDLPDIVNVARELIADQNMSGRISFIPGDYHDTGFPKGNDVALFFGMLHQESPESIMDLFERAYEALEPGGIVYVMDMMTDSSGTAPKFSALFGLNMALTMEHGWVFSDKELEGWLEQAGFADFRVAPLAPPMPHWLASAKKPE